MEPMNPSQPPEPSPPRDSPQEAPEIAPELEIPVLDPWERGGPDARNDPQPEPEADADADPESKNTPASEPEAEADSGSAPWEPRPVDDTPPNDEDNPEADARAAVRLWGTEHPKLSGAGWRRAQRLEPVVPEEPANKPKVRGTRRPDAVGQALDAIREQTDARLDALDETITQLARNVQDSMWTSSSAEIRRELNDLREAIAARTSVFQRSVPEAGAAPEAGGPEGSVDSLRDAVAYLSDLMVRSAEEQTRRVEEVTQQAIGRMGRDVAALATDFARRTDQIEASFSERVIRLAEGLQAGAATQTERTRAAVAEALAGAGQNEQSEALNAALAALSKQLDARTAGLDRLVAQMDGANRSIAELRASLPGSDALGALIQSEIQGVRSELSALREGSDTDLGRRLDGIETQLGGVAAGLKGLTARMEDLPPADALTEILRAESERSRGEVRELGETLRSLVADLRDRADRIEGEVETLGARIEAGRTDADPVLRLMQSEAEATRRELARVAEATDARARTIIASMAREVLAVAEGQRELRAELQRLAARIVGRPLI
jgi:hypothetical protein